MVNIINSYESLGPLDGWLILKPFGALELQSSSSPESTLLSE